MCELGQSNGVGAPCRRVLPLRKNTAIQLGHETVVPQFGHEYFGRWFYALTELRNKKEEL
jgi:hypothetical protein